MPYTTTRRLHDVFNRKVMKYLMYKKAKRMYSLINRELGFFEDRYLRNRAHA